MEAVLGQLKTRLISPKNFPSFMVANTTVPSSLTTSTVPRLMKNIWKRANSRQAARRYYVHHEYVSVHDK